MSNLSKAALAAAVFAASASAMADPPLVREISSDSTPACKIDPFADLGARARESQFLTTCGGDHTRLMIDSPRPAYDRPETRYTRAEFGTLSSASIAGVLSTIRFSWAGARDQDTGHARSSNGMVAAGGLLRLFDDVDLQMSLGRKIVGGAESRATVTTSWRPTPRGMLFTDWTTTMMPGADAHRVGALWWLVPSRLFVDVGARYVQDGAGWRDQHIGITLTGFRF